MAYPFKLVGVSGTFDRLHKGHRVLLSKALEVGERVMVGLTSDEMCFGKQLSGKIEPFKVRRANLERFFEEMGSLSRVEIVTLNDPYGPAIEDSELEAIVAGEDVAWRVDEINRIREKKGLPPLELIVVELVKASDGERISSTRIRKGEIDGEGRLQSIAPPTNQ
ncbi:MAG: phosphopantetheine adenylyltransferase [Candidatus Freyarchaeota archaeon]|nr:phosphopantetheine adenylyltransferase [Candidatus Jordarchaeia archaeon]